MEKLQEMLDMQRALQKRLGTDFYELSDEERAQFIKDHFVYLDQELQEALYEMPYFKAWKDYSTMSVDDRVKAWGKVKMELVDAWHFFMNLLLCVGFTADELYTMYMAKNKENHRRQDAGYTADVSYKNQSIEEVMGEPGPLTPTNIPLSSVRMDDETYWAGDFITIHNAVDGSQKVLYNTDALSMGMAVRCLATEYYKMLKSCSTEELKEIESVIGPLDFCKELVINE